MEIIKDSSKKKIAMINAISFGSTGKIMQGIGHVASEKGYDVHMFAALNVQPMYTDSIIYQISDSKYHRISVFMNKLTGLEGCFSVWDTFKLIRKLNEHRPEIVHLHILHHGYVNLPMLFWYLKRRQIHVVWTFHDCWSFTGHCPHFVCEKCEKWKTGCYSCPRYKSYPKSIYDNSRFIWKWKKRWFLGFRNLTIVTPSVWLSDMVRQSFLQNYPLRVINNGIDLNIFRYLEQDIEESRFIVLGVASFWNKKKGIDVFVELSKRLPQEYQIVLIGTTDAVAQQLPSNIISMRRINDQQKLAEIYAQATVFVNPTREDTYPTVNLEAIACGTPVVTFRTGGSPESIIEGKTGFVVDCDDIDAMEKAIKKVCASKKQMTQYCLEAAKEFDMNDRFSEYLELYESIYKELMYV